MSGDKNVWSWGCSKCKGQEHADGDEMRPARNCDTIKAALYFDWAPELRSCPWSEIGEEAWECVQWWVEWKEYSVLPWGGQDLMAQPAFVFEAFMVCQNVKNELESKEHEKQQQEVEKMRAKNKQAGARRG